MVNSYVLLGLEASPSVFERLLSVVPDDLWDVRADPDRFTVREVYAHLAEWEPVLQARLSGTLLTDRFILPNYDPAELAIEHGYAKIDPEESVEKFRRGRAETVALIRSLPAAAYNRVGVHPIRGPMTIGDQINAMLGHDMYHIEQVSQHIRGGRPAAV
ncbi:MAG TPA: DinB family protein [Fimbriimonadaceae bacterium]|nr:DinB family protein [Fimbriimonadaceae bacterium]